MTTITSASVLYILSLQSETSKVAMKSTLNLIAKKLQGVSSHTEADWSKLNYENVLTLMNTLKAEGLSPARVNTYLAAVKGVAKYSWMNKSIDVEVYTWIQQVKRLKGTRETKGRSLSMKDVATMVEYCDNTSTAIRDSALIALTYSAGMRRDEVSNLSISDIDLSEGSVTILGKGNKQAINYINVKAVTALNSWLKVRGTGKGALFTRIRKGNKLTSEGMTNKSVSDIIIKRAKETKIGKLTAHDLRRSFATNLLDAGEDLFVVCDLMRHSDVQTTKTYDHRGQASRKLASINLTF